MSSQDSETSSGTNAGHSDRVDTDSVHSRFRTTYVHCDICDLDISANHSAIERHFSNSHPSKEHCCYCKGKVFTYTQMPIDSPIEEPTRFVYHKCNKL